MTPEQIEIFNKKFGIKNKEIEEMFDELETNPLFQDMLDVADFADFELEENPLYNILN